MTGAILQLVARGVQDKYLTEDPTITFFKVNFRRHVNFSTESFPVSLRNDEGMTYSAIVPRMGDLITGIVLEVALPALPKLDQIQVAWSKYLGHLLVEEYHVSIDDEIIDARYGEWLHLWSEVSSSDLPGLHRMIGHRPDLYEFSSGKDSTLIYVPLETFFTKNLAVALPLIALQEKVGLTLKMRKLRDCLRLSATHSSRMDGLGLRKGEEIELGGSTVTVDHYDVLDDRLYYTRPSGTRPVNQGLFDFFSDPITLEESNERSERPDWLSTLRPLRAQVFMNYVYLAKVERDRYVSQVLEYLVDLVERTDQKVLQGSMTSQNLPATNLCTSLIWIGKRENAASLFDYTDGKGNPLITHSSLKLEGLERVEWRPSSYFRLVQPLQYYRRLPPIGSNYYSFELYHDQVQPSGALNLAPLERVELLHKFQPGVSGIKTVTTYLRKLNRLVIFSGIGRLGFSQRDD